VYKTSILIADDEPAVLRFISAGLQSEGYVVAGAEDGEEALRFVKETSPDLVILDVIMPKLDGFETCRIIRQVSQIPIIMLSGRMEWADKVKGLNLGADDYLIKPFGIQELLARVRAVLRRTKATEMRPGEPDIESGGLQMNFARGRLATSGQEIGMTPMGRPILSGRQREILFIVAEGRSNKEIAALLQVSQQTVKNHMTNIMSKLEANDRGHAVVLAHRLGLLAL